jgi:DNA-binding IclR family transcriptional regulator
VSVLDSFDPQDPRQGPADIARRTALQLAVVERSLELLTDVMFVNKHDDGSYALGHPSLD